LGSKRYSMAAMSCVDELDVMLSRLTINEDVFVRKCPQGTLNYRQVLVYKDKGADESSASALATEIRAIGQNKIPVNFATAAHLRSPDWQAKTALLVMGGGTALQLDAQLGEKGVQNIYSFVQEEDGRYVGICAGAYFASKVSQFSAGNTSYKRERSLAFFPGTAYGPVYPDIGQDYLSPEAAKAARIGLYALGREQYKPSLTGLAFYVAGSAFKVNATHRSKVRVLGKYLDTTPASPAIIACKAGRAKMNTYRVCLSGIHPEYQWIRNQHENTRDPRIKKLLDKLYPFETFRNYILRHMLTSISVLRKIPK
jgi:biotin---protein ligase